MRLITILLATCLIVACGDDTAPGPDLGVDATTVVDAVTTTEDSIVAEDGTTEDSSAKDLDSAFVD